MIDRRQIGRLAIREIKDEIREIKDEIRAYYAMPETMKGALLLGTIKASLVRRDRALFDRFMALMRDAVSQILKDIVGTKPEWPNQPRRAPEAERGVEPWSNDA